MENGSVLAPYRVLDLSDESGFSCGKILADLGADVIKVEPPGGDAARLIGPFPGDRPDPEKSIYFISYNAGKRGITLNVQSPAGRDLLRKLVARADFLIETFPPGTLQQWGVSFETLRRLNPRMIVVLFTPFGQTGPYCGYKGKDLVGMGVRGFVSLPCEGAKKSLCVFFLL